MIFLRLNSASNRLWFICSAIWADTKEPASVTGRLKALKLTVESDPAEHSKLLREVCQISVQDWPRDMFTRLYTVDLC